MQQRTKSTHTSRIRQRRLALVLDERQQAYLTDFCGGRLTGDALVLAVAKERLESRRALVLRALGLLRCAFRGRVRPWHRSLARALDRLDAELGS